MELLKKLVEVATGDMVTGHGGGGLGLILGVLEDLSNVCDSVG